MNHFVYDINSYFKEAEEKLLEVVDGENVSKMFLDYFKYCIGFFIFIFISFFINLFFSKW